MCLKTGFLSLSFISLSTNLNKIPSPYKPTSDLWCCHSTYVEFIQDQLLRNSVLTTETLLGFNQLF